jgi:hypothetical protein
MVDFGMVQKHAFLGNRRQYTPVTHDAQDIDRIWAGLWSFKRRA